MDSPSMNERRLSGGAEPSAGSATSVLQARGLRKQFFRKGRESARHFDAVAPCDVDLAQGELVVLMGRSGSGKSTLLNMLAGLLEPSEGTVEFRGQDLYALGDAELSRTRNASFGVVPQGQTAIASLSVIGNVMLPASLYRGDPNEEKAMRLLEGLGIASLADSRPSELSGGELRRMAIARSLICEPDVLFADEPTSDLDDENTSIVLETLRQVAEAGTSVLMVTHEKAASAIADRELHMSAGALSVRHQGARSLIQ